MCFKKTSQQCLSKLEAEISHFSEQLEALMKYWDAYKKCVVIRKGKLWLWKDFIFATEELCFMTQKTDAKSEEKLTCGLKNDMGNLANWPNTRKSHNLHFNGLLLTKVYNVWAKIL